MLIGTIKKLVHLPQPTVVAARKVHVVRPAALDVTDKVLKLGRPLAPNKLDGDQILLAAKGWSSAVVVCIRNGKKVYVVACSRGEEMLVGESENLHAAWRHVTSQAK